MMSTPRMQYATDHNLDAQWQRIEPLHATAQTLAAQAVRVGRRGIAA